jgi:signal transduction histidine kinase/ActR/RegA family two-component response regulator
MARVGLSDLRITAAILEAENTPAAILDASGSVAECNAAFRTRIGFDFRDEVFLRSLKMTLGTNMPVPCGVRRGDGAWEYGKLTGLDGLGGERVTLLRLNPQDQIQPLPILTRQLDQGNTVVSAKARKESTYGLIFNSIGVGILVAEANGRVLESNAAMIKMVGPVIHLEEFFPKETWQSYLSKNRPDLAANSDPFRFTNLSGEAHFAEITVETTSAVDGQLSVIVFQDVTDRIRLEEAKATAEQADQQMRMALHRDKAKTHFLSMMSHELRTPLHGVISALELMGHHGIDEPELYDLFRIASRASEAALDQVNRILEITRLEMRIGSDLTADNFDLVDLVQDVIEQQAAYARKSGNRINFIRSGLNSSGVLGDAYLFRQIVQNLIGNALKFTKNGTIDVSLDIAAADQSRNRIILTIADTGIGFDISQKDRLLQEFETGNDRYSRIEEGAGIGLSLVNRAVAAMSGDLQVTSVLGKGSSFKVRFDLPCGNKAAPAEQAAKRDAATSVYALRALVVDDAEINREVLARLLHRYGCVTLCAQDGQAALDTLAVEKFDIIFMDVSMPGIDGIEATRRFRATEAGPHTMIVGVTAHTDLETRELCLEAGMEDVVVKPFRPTIMEGLLKARVHKLYADR